MFEFEACELFKIMEFTYVNDIFKDEHNEEIEYNEHTLINYSAKLIIIVYK